MDNVYEESEKKSRKQITGGIHLEVIGKAGGGLNCCKIITGKDHL